MLTSARRSRLVELGWVVLVGMLLTLDEKTSSADGSERLCRALIRSWLGGKGRGWGVGEGASPKSFRKAKGWPSIGKKQALARATDPRLNATFAEKMSRAR